MFAGDADDAGGVHAVLSRKKVLKNEQPQA
jgi:hypothetical protein